MMRLLILQPSGMGEWGRTGKQCFWNEAHAQFLVVRAAADVVPFSCPCRQLEGEPVDRFVIDRFVVISSIAS